MAKKNSLEQQLLAGTSASRLKDVALGTALSCFVYIGAVITTDAALILFTSTPGTLLF